MKLYRNKIKGFAMMFIDLGTYSRVPREVIWSCSKKKDMPFEYIGVIRDMHKRAKGRLKALGRDTKDLHLDIGLH